MNLFGERVLLIYVELKKYWELMWQGHAAAHVMSCHVRSSVSVREVGHGMTRRCFSSRRLAGLFWCVWKWQSFGPWTHKYPATFNPQHNCLFLMLLFNYTAFGSQDWMWCVGGGNLNGDDDGWWWMWWHLTCCNPKLTSANSGNPAAKWSDAFWASVTNCIQHAHCK